MNTRTRFRLLSLILSLLFVPGCFAQTMTTITASHLLNVDGTPVTGKFCIAPALSNGAPSGFTFGGGGQGSAAQRCFTVTAGVLQAGATAPDTSVTVPQNLCLTGTLSSPNQGPWPIRTWQCLQPSGATWSLDAVTVSTPAQQVVQVTGPTGPTGPAGVGYIAGITTTGVMSNVNSVINVMANPYNAKGDCATDDSSAISAAVTAAAGLAEVYYPKAPGGCYLVSTPTTIPAGVVSTFARGAVVKTPSTSTWSINGPISAGRYQIFDAGSVISLASNNSVLGVAPEWFGADGSGVNPSAVAWQDAVNTARNIGGAGGAVSCPIAVYSIENTVTSFAQDTGHGISLIGPDTQNNGASGACSLKWTGPVGGTVFHYIGGHQGLIKNIVFNANSSASRGLWLDSANGAASSSVSITGVARSCLAGTSCTTGQGNIVTVTVASSPVSGGWQSGTDITLAGVTDPSFNGVFPVWYQVDTTHYVFSQGGPLASSSGGTASTTSAVGDIAGIRLDHVQVYAMASQTASVSSCSVSGSVESCTVSAPVLQYPNEWTWTSGATDPVYNAYWKLASVTSATSFTATATEVSSESANTTGTFQGPSSGISLGSNQFSLLNNSVCCTDFNGVIVSAYGVSPTPLMAYSWDGQSNVKDFKLKNAVASQVRIAFAGFGTGGNFDCENCGGTSVTDALYASSVLGTAHIHDVEWEQLGTAYVLASLPSGSFNAASLGTTGQFELGNSTGTIELDHVNVESHTFAPDGVAIGIGGNLILLSNNLGYAGNTASFVTSIVTATPGSGQTPGTYTLSATGGGGAGAQVSVIVSGAGTVTQPPTILNQGAGYTSAPTFTLSAGGTAATFTPALGLNIPLINMGTYYNSVAPVSSLTSIGNTYYNVPAGGWLPVIEKGLYGNGTYTAYGSAARLGGMPVTTFGDFGTSASGVQARLSEGSTQTELRYAAPPTGTPLDDATVGFPKLPNNTPGPGWRNAADGSDCWLVLDASNSLDEDCGALGSPTVNPFTTQGNTFNGNSQLVQTTSGGKVPTSVLPLGTASAPGAVQCDGTTTTCSGGVITAVAGTAVLPHQVAAVAPTLYSSTSSIATTTIYTPSSAGQYRMCAFVYPTVAGTAGTVAIGVADTFDGHGGNNGVTPSLSLTGAFFMQQGCFSFYSDASQPIQYYLTMASATGTPTIRYGITLEKLQ